MAGLIKPHGSDFLRPRLLQGEFLTEEYSRAQKLPKINVTPREVGDIVMMAIGAYTPLEGFMRYEDWDNVCRYMRLHNGLFWPIPITLSTTKQITDGIQVGDQVGLWTPQDDMCLAILTVEEKYKPDKLLECKNVYLTDDNSHPGVRVLFEQGPMYLAGPVECVSTGHFLLNYPNYFLTPQQSREIFHAKGWRNVTAFQTRNPMHRAHEYLVKVALEVSDGVMVHSVLGDVCSEDIPPKVCAEAIRNLLGVYFVRDRVIQAGHPGAMRYAGPREALLHALFRQNFGCSKIVIGRDHAGVGDYYGHYEAQLIFDQISDDALLIKPLKLEGAFWCTMCDGMSTARTCPHDAADCRIHFSGSILREALAEGKDIPEHFSRPEVIKILREYYANKRSG